MGRTPSNCIGQFEEGRDFLRRVPRHRCERGPAGDCRRECLHPQRGFKSRGLFQRTDHEVGVLQQFRSRFRQPRLPQREVPLVIADGSTDEDIVASHTKSAASPPRDAVEARVSFVFRQPGLDGGAVHIDAVSLVATDPTPGDFDNSGFVDGADFLVWQRGELTSPPSGTDLAGWQGNYGISPSSLATHRLRCRSRVRLLRHCLDSLRCLDV